MRILGVSKSFDGSLVLDGFSKTLPESGIVGISGPSGIGKTTLLRIIAGLEKPDSGSVEGAPSRMSVQFDDDRLFPWMNVMDNVTLVGCSESRARGLLESLGIGDKADAAIGSLSGGQRRRVALARALAYPAPVMILDEPTARLDAETADLVVRVIERECAGGLAIVASHDDAVLSRCNKVYSI